MRTLEPVAPEKLDMAFRLFCAALEGRVETENPELLPPTKIEIEDGTVQEVTIADHPFARATTLLIKEFPEDYMTLTMRIMRLSELASKPPKYLRMLVDASGKGIHSSLIFAMARVAMTTLGVYSKQEYKRLAKGYYINGPKWDGI